MRSGVSHKKQPPEMSITGGRNPPIDKEGGLLAGGGNQVIRFRIRLLCALAHISWRDCYDFQDPSNGENGGNRGTPRSRPARVSNSYLKSWLPR